MPVLPYLPFTVEEAASVTCLAHWSNTRARVVGRVVAWSPGAAEAELEAQGEGEVAQVRACLAAVVDGVLPWLEVGALVQVLGELQVHQGAPVLAAHLVRPCRGLDPRAYYRAVCRVQSRLPCNVRR